MPELRVPKGVWTLVREALRHLLRRPVVGIAAAARTSDGRWVLIRRGDTGEWALPGGTLEWGETLTSAIERELREEAGVDLERVQGVSGVYSRPDRDPRFHAVTVVIRALVSEPREPPVNPVEIRDVQLFEDRDIPSDLGMGCADMIGDARGDGTILE